jgi:hypothetical protein
MTIPGLFPTPVPAIPEALPAIPEYQYRYTYAVLVLDRETAKNCRSYVTPRRPHKDPLPTRRYPPSADDNRHIVCYRKHVPEALGATQTGAMVEVAPDCGSARISSRSASLSVVPRRARP